MEPCCVNEPFFENSDMQKVINKQALFVINRVGDKNFIYLYVRALSE